MEGLAISSHREASSTVIHSDQKQSKFLMIDPSYLKKINLQAGMGPIDLRGLDTLFKVLVIALVVVSCLAIACALPASAQIAGYSAATFMKWASVGALVTEIAILVSSVYAGEKT